MREERLEEEEEEETSVGEELFHKERKRRGRQV